MVNATYDSRWCSALGYIDSGWACKHRLTRSECGSAGLENNNQSVSHQSVTDQVVQFFPYFAGTGPQNIPAGDKDNPQSHYRAGFPGFTPGIPRQPL